VLARPKLFGALLVGAAIWTAFIWLFRIINIAGGGHAAAFVVVHGGLALVSVVLAIPVAYVGLWLWRASL